MQEEGGRRQLGSSQTARDSFSAILFALIALSALGSKLSAQTADIRGIVSDSTTGERLPYANVVIRNSQRGAATNLNGFYLIPSVPRGEFEVVASYIGYESRTSTVFVGDSSVVILNFRLTQTSVRSGEVVVTGRQESRLSEISTSVQSMSAEEIRSVPVPAQEDLFRSLGVLPSFVSTSDVSSRFFVRGGAGDQNLILLDGMKIYNPYHAFGVFSSFDPELVRTADVYVGAFPPGYGGSLSSVVDIKTRSGRSDRPGARASVTFLSADAGVEGTTFLGGGITWIGSVRRSLFNQTLTKFLKQSTPLSFYDTYVKATFPGDQGGFMSVQGFFSGDDVRDPDPLKPDYQWRTSSVALRLTGLVSDRLYSEGTVYISKFTAMVDPKSSTTIRPEKSSVREPGLKAQLTAYGESGDFYIFGFNMAFPELEFTLVNQVDANVRLYSINPEGYCWFRYQTVSDPWMLDAGVQLDFVSPFVRTVSYEIFQPRLNVAYTLNETWKLKASYGRITQQSVTVNNEDDIISLFDAWISVPTNYRSEIADHYVGGVGGNITPDLSVDFQAYYKYFSNLLTYNRDKIDALDPDYIQGRGRSYGLETMVRWKNDWFDGYAAYSLGWARLRNGGIIYPPRYDRRHSLKTMATRQLLAGLELVVRWDYGSGLPFSQSIGYFDRLTFGDPFRNPDPGETGTPYIRLGQKNGARLPPYHRLDIGMSYTFSLGALKSSLGISIINVYSSKNLFYFDRKTGERIDMLPFFPSLTLKMEY